MLWFEQEKGRKLSKQNVFLTCFWRFLGSSTLEQLKSGKKLGFRNLQEKLENSTIYKKVGRKSIHSFFTFTNFFPSFEFVSIS